VGEAFATLTTVPGPDIAPYHDRRIVILDRAHWADCRTCVVLVSVCLCHWTLK